jgi:hypothetical protein
VDAVKTEKEPLYKKLTEYHRFMLGKFKDIVDYKSTA